MATNNQQSQDWVELDPVTFEPVQQQTPNQQPAEQADYVELDPETLEPVQQPRQEKGFIDWFTERYSDTATQGMLGALSQRYYDWTDYGHEQLRKRYPNKTDAEIELLADRTITQVRKNMLKEIEQRQEADPAWRPEESWVENLLSPERWAPALLGTIGGSASPVDFIAPGAGSVAKNIGTGVGVNVIEDVGTQGLDIVSGVQDEYRPEQTAMAGALGGAFQGAIELPGAIYRDIRGPGKVSPDLGDKIEAGKVDAPTAPKTDAEVLRDFEIENDIADMVEQGATLEDLLAAHPEYYQQNPDAAAVSQQWIDYKAGGGTERMRFRDTEEQDAETFERAFADIMDEAGLPGVRQTDETVPGTEIPTKKTADNTTAKTVDTPTQAREGVRPPVMTPRQQETLTGVEEITKDWENVPDFEVVDNIDDLPGPIRNAMYADGAEDAFGFVGPDGIVRIVASNINDKSDLEAVVFHEMLGHRGLQNLFSDRLDEMLNGLLENAPQFRARAEEWITRNTGEDGSLPYGGDRTRAAEEVLAEMSEAGQITPTIMQRLRQMVEQLARRMGLKKTFSDNDIRMILSRAHRTVVDGKGGRGKPSTNIEGMRYMTAWHGSPHDFDKFLTDFIGTGEGAQAFGWGLYFAGNKRVAEGYRDSLTFGKAGPVFVIGGDRVQGPSSINLRYTHHLNSKGIDTEPYTLWLDAIADFIRNRGRLPLAAEELINHAEATYSLSDWDWVVEGLQNPNRVDLVDNLLDEAHSMGFSRSGEEGKLYQVELPDDGVWLDLDLRIPDQPAEVKEALKALGFEPDVMFTKTGMDLVKTVLPRKFLGDHKKVSQTLRMYGITGNKYLDSGSRMRGQGSHNYVVFDDSDVVVTNKYMRGRGRKKDEGKGKKFAGNLNLDNIETGPQVKEYLKQTADKFPTRRTTREEIKDLADTLSMSPADVKNLAKRMVRAEEVHAARMTVLRSAEEVEDMARAYMKGTLSEQEKIKFGAKAARHAAIQEALMDITGEAGRVLGVFSEKVRTSQTGDMAYMLRDMPNELLRKPEFLDAIAERIVKNPDKVHKVTREAFHPNASDYFFSVWYNMMLSRPTTHVANIVGTLSNIVLSLSTYSGAALVGQTRRFNKVRQTDLRTGYQLLERSNQLADRAAMTGNRGLREEASKIRDRAMRIIDANDRVTGREVAARIAGAVLGIGQGFANAPKAFVLGMPLHRVSRVEHQTAILPGPLTALETPVRFMAATDEFFRNIIQMSDYYGSAVRQAVGEGRKGKDFIDRTMKLIDKPTDEMLMRASDQAQVLQFLDDPSAIGKSIEGWRNKKPGDNIPTQIARGTLRLFVPFIRSPDSLIRTAIRYSPVGAFGTDRYNIADLAAGGARRDLAKTRIAIGSMIALYVAYLAEQGLVSGEGPRDYRKRQEKESTGWRPNSFKVGDQWISYEGLEPVSIPVNIAATLMERGEERNLKAQEEEGRDATEFEQAFAAALGFSEALSNNTWTESLHDMMNTLAGSQTGETGAANAVAGIASTAVPAVVRGYNQDIVDTTRRVTTGTGSLEDRVTGRMQAAVPGMSQDLPPARDVFGRAIEREGSPELPFIGEDASNLLNRSKKSTISDDPVDQELQRLSDSVSGVVIGIPSKNNLKTWRGERDLTAEEHSEYIRISGQNLYYWMQDFIQSDKYKNMSDAERIKAIQKERNKIRKETREMLFGTSDTPPSNDNDEEQDWEYVEL